MQPQRQCGNLLLQTDSKRQPTGGIPTNSQQFSFTNLEKPKEHNIQGEERGSKDQMEAEVRKRKIMQKLQVSMVYQCKRKTKIEI